MDLYKMSYAEAAETAVSEIMEACGVGRNKAVQLFKNAIIYNCVVAEIVQQAEFLAGNDVVNDDIY